MNVLLSGRNRTARRWAARDPGGIARCPDFSAPALGRRTITRAPTMRAWFSDPRPSSPRQPRQRRYPSRAQVVPGVVRLTLLAISVAFLVACVPPGEFESETENELVEQALS